MKAMILSFTKSRWKKWKLDLTADQIEDVMFGFASVLTAFVFVVPLVSLIGVLSNG